MKKDMNEDQVLGGGGVFYWLLDCIEEYGTLEERVLFRTLVRRICKRTHSIVRAMFPTKGWEWRHYTGFSWSVRKLSYLYKTPIDFNTPNEYVEILMRCPAQGQVSYVTGVFPPVSCSIGSPDNLFILHIGNMYIATYAHPTVKQAA